ncbi:MAG TPA: sigma 54-interacting transcriptional regulator [Gemmatimonadales bacterium]|nr:sigma 54-interacting transcriptional regulator [Gemmatimonadales bacterium]
MTTALHPCPPPSDSPPAFVGRSASWLRVVALAERYAPTKLPVLLIGATGTGKEVLAQFIHRTARRGGELVDINCGALPREMTESLLFGHRRGAFTGAVEESVGLIARAAGGTLFLDELASMPVEGQAKLLRVLETGEVRRLGDGLKQRVDFRVIAAVQDGVERHLEAGLLRTDLYHRLASVVIHVPRLRDRIDDIEPLAAHFARLHGRTLLPAALPPLLAYDWPGNVRELRAVIDRATVLSDGDALHPDHIVEALDGVSGHIVGAHRTSPAVTAEAIKLRRLCQQLGGDGRAIARAIGVSRATLYRRLKQAGIQLRLIQSQASPRSDLMPGGEF